MMCRTLLRGPTLPYPWHLLPVLLLINNSLGHWALPTPLLSKKGYVGPKRDMSKKTFSVAMSQARLKPPKWLVYRLEVAWVLLRSSPTWAVNPYKFSHLICSSLLYIICLIIARALQPHPTLQICHPLLFYLPLLSIEAYRCVFGVVWLITMYKIIPLADQFHVSYNYWLEPINFFIHVFLSSKLPWILLCKNKLTIIDSSILDITVLHQMPFHHLIFQQPPSHQLISISLTWLQHLMLIIL